MPEQEANMFTTVFIIHRPYFQHPETRDFWTQDMAYKWKTYPHPYTLIHDTSVTSVLKSYLMELNNVQPPAINIHHTSVGPSHTLEIIPKTQTCTPGTSSSPQGILVMEQCPDYTNVLFQDAQDPWEDFQSILHTENPHYTVTDPDPPATSAPKDMTNADEEAYLQAEAYLDQRQIHRAKCQYEKETESSDFDDISVISTVQTVNHVSTIPRPSLKMSILPSKFHKPIPVIGFIDTGADTSMIDPFVLPSDCWEKHLKLFRAVNGETFETTLTTKKPIGIQFFPNCIIWKKIVASTLPDKDLLIDTLHLYILSETPSPYSHISQKFLEFCPENHSQFHHPSALWKNEQFFIHLPFKLNKDINPTKASHPGMSPSDLLLAKQECSQLLQQGLIKPTNSYWACQAFYVEKRSELLRGKKRLVIDYQPLNSFLKDDKFPLPKIQTLFVHLQGARIFSKFDLNVGFWQLGISPVDRHKTAFCILDAHYQWTVMPFSLKVAPLLFQKAMTKIFSLVLHHALAYIDDILLFSYDHESHQKLLLDFFQQKAYPPIPWDC
ncbi:hypothetical protein KPL71_017494 [Citrus sinensis]|uniref:Uncharacterized protein n=1 Tax=Citrus sinensis TaxID=2711 RepID=A0ACB8JPI9_CITSI|nr:hypothetical protein KPL71_017494 [Citrus sinensis]